MPTKLPRKPLGIAMKTDESLWDFRETFMKRSWHCCTSRVSSPWTPMHGGSVMKSNGSPHETWSRSALSPTHGPSLAGLSPCRSLDLRRVDFVYLSVSAYYLHHLKLSTRRCFFGLLLLYHSIAPAVPLAIGYLVSHKQALRLRWEHFFLGWRAFYRDTFCRIHIRPCRVGRRSFPDTRFFHRAGDLLSRAVRGLIYDTV